MNKVWIGLMLCLLAFGSLAEENWRRGPDNTWMIKLEPALEKARRENKFVYVLNTGSDWCGFCKVLMRDVLSRPLFTEFARKHLVLVYLDQPSKKVAMPQSQRDYNRATARKLSFGGGVPSARLLDADGKPVAYLSGYMAEPLYITNLCKKLNINELPEFPAKVETTLIPRKKNTNRKFTASIQLAAWGYSPDQVDKPVSLGEVISVPPGKELFFKVIYTLPENFQATLHLFSQNDVKFSSLSGRIFKSGVYIFKTTAPLYAGSWGSSSSAMKAVIEPHNRNFSIARCNLPCRFNLNPELLDETDSAAFEQHLEKLRRKFAASEFEIVSWGTGRNFDTPYSPEQGIRVKPRKYVRIKVRYSLPETKAYVGVSSDLRAPGTMVSCQRTGEAVFNVFVSKNCSNLYVTIRPRNSAVLNNIISIPCRITVDE